MAKAKQSIQHIDDILNEATDLTDNKVTYSNTVRFNISLNEVTLDFYTLGPDSKDIKSLKAIRVQRTIMPLSAAKEIAGLLQKGIAEWEATFGIDLPFEPQNASDNE